MDDSWTKHHNHYLAIVHRVSDVIRLTTKDSVFWRWVAWLLFLASFGRFSRQQFLENFATTLGPIQAYPRQWQELSADLLTHEARHTHQFLVAGWFVPLFGWIGRRVRVWAGLLPMSLVYGFFPLPIFFAWGRFRLELDADAYSWRVALEQGWATPEEVRQRARWFAEVVSSWSYLRAWPRSWAIAKFEQRAERIIASWHERKR